VISRLALILVLLGSPAYAGGDPVKELGLQALHEHAPDIVIEDFQGNTTKISDHLGHPIVLHFWATWCTGCVQELPQLAALAQVFGKDSITFFAISIDERGKKMEIERFVGDLQPRLATWIPQSPAQAERYWAWGVPMTYFINAKGEIVARGMGAKNWSKIPSTEWSTFFQSLK